MTRRLINEGIAFFEKNELDKADTCFKSVLEQNERHHYALNLLGLSAFKRKEYEPAITLLRRALEISPGRAMYHHNLAVILSVTGNFEESHVHFRLAIQNKPDYAEAYFNFAKSHKFEAGDPLLEPLEALLSANELGQDDLCFLHFAAGKIYDDLGQYDRAFHHFELGNRARETDFSAVDLELTCNAIVSCFTPEVLSKPRKAVKTVAQPIFIVGMPRSGTTLLEQVLASHSAVTGAGELNDMQSIARSISGHHSEKIPYPEYISMVPDEILSGYANSYLQRTAGMAKAGQRVVDKMPSNFLRLGLIRMMFPGASIIHCRRNKYDTCLSCYFQRFTYRQDFSYAMEDLAFYYRQYEKVMQHWSALGLDFLTVDYEDIVRYPEQEARKLVAYCGLDWEDACLEFHKTDRPVTTASYLQVRQPLYDSSLERWRSYEKHIEPLKRALQ